MTALKKIELIEVSEVSVFDGAHTGMISSTCIQRENVALGSFGKSQLAGKVAKSNDIFDGCATGLVSSTC